MSTPYLAVAIPTTDWLLQCLLGKSGGQLLLKLKEYQVCVLLKIKMNNASHITDFSVQSVPFKGKAPGTSFCQHKDTFFAHLSVSVITIHNFC